MNILELLLGQIPEAMFFALFMIYTKELKEKRFIFIILMVLEYIFLKLILSFNIWFQVIYTCMTFIILKILYKSKTQITDVFTFAISSLIMGVIETVLYFIIWMTINNFLVFVILVDIVYILFFILFRKKLCKIQNLYKKLWNRNRQKPNKIKSTTFRCINIVVFNIMFYLINLCIMFILVQNGGV